MNIDPNLVLRAYAYLSTLVKERGKSLLDQDGPSYDGRGRVSGYLEPTPAAATILLLRAHEQMTPMYVLATGPDFDFGDEWPIEGDGRQWGGIGAISIPVKKEPEGDEAEWDCVFGEFEKLLEQVRHHVIDPLKEILAFGTET